MIEQELYAHLNAANLASGKIYPLKMPGNTVKPAIVYTTVNKRDIQYLGGQKFREEIRLQIDCYAETYAAVKQLEEETKAVLYLFEYPPYELRSIDGYEDQTKLYRQILDFKIQGK